MPDRLLFIYVATLITISIIFAYSLSSYTVLYYERLDYHFLIRQASFGLFSIVIIWTIALLDPRIWLHRIGFLLFFGGLFAMAIMPFLPTSLSHAVGGAKRWITLPGLSIAPVEFFKIGFIYFLSWSFSRRFENEQLGLKDEFKRFLPYAAIFFVAVFLIAVMQNDLGQVIVLGLILAFLLLFAGSSFWFFLSLLGGALVVFISFIISAEHRIYRIKQWWSSTQDFILSYLPEFIASHLRIENVVNAYQTSHSLNAIKNGGWFGVGLGNGNLKLGYLSEVHTDFVLAGITEELGYIGLLIVTFITLLILHRIFKISNRAKNRHEHLFCLGVGLVIAFAFLINAYGVSGITPVKGIAVPFFKLWW